MIGNGSWLAIATWQRMLKNIVIIKRCCQTIEKALGQPTQQYIDKLHLPGLAYELYLGKRSWLRVTSGDIGSQSFPISDLREREHCCLISFEKCGERGYFIHGEVQDYGAPAVPCGK